nr:class I SAM-dependent methyltransferase [Bacteriovorax sp. HI3]
MRYVLEHQDEADRLEFQATIPQYSIKDETATLDIPKNAKVLDAGCGTGVLARYVKHQFPDAEVHGFDYSELRVSEANKRNKETHNKITFFHDNIEKLDIPENSYDVVVSRYVIEHLPNPQAAIKELYRVLKPGGKLFIIDFDGIFINLFSTNARFNELLEQIKSGFKSDLYVGRKLPAYFHQAGFKNIDYDVTAVQFKGENAEMEYENNHKRCLNCQVEFARILGSEKLAEEFAALYLKESIKPGSVLFYNKFIVSGIK